MPFRFLCRVLLTRYSADLRRAFGVVLQDTALFGMSIRDSDLILVMENGRIVEQGNHEQLMERNGRYAKMYLTQTGAHSDSV